MPHDTPVAQRGQMLAGVFEIDIARRGVADNIRVFGQGSKVDSVERPPLPTAAAAGVLRIPFRATPDDPDQPITLSFTFDGRAVSRTYYVGPQAGARRGKDRPAVQVEAGAPPPGGAQGPASVAGGAITLHFKGRIVYDRPSSVDDDGNGVAPTTEEGVHGVWFEVVDEDDISDETIWSGFTDRNGNFDTGEFLWDDCDAVGCDDPDLYLRWECDTNIVNVQDATDITEPDYSWSNEAQVIDDFTGSFHDFGTLKPADAADMPVLHIHNSIIRAFRFIRDKSGTGIELEELDVLYPDGDNAFYVPFYEEIHVGAFRRWQEAAHTHEYGHHFMENYAINETPEYCNEVCDTNGDCSHCVWCAETEQVAWSEGWPNWLADVVTRDYAVSYTFSDGTPYVALVGLSLETVQMCDEPEHTYDHPLRTEGFLGALLRDIEDDTQDEHLYENTEFNLIVIKRDDCLALGSDEIFAITTGPQPTTLAQFLSIFLQLYPEHTPALYATLRNLPPSENDFIDYLQDLFPPDTQPLGAVQTVTSQTHPLGSGDPSPCITVSWDTPPDDVVGAGGYSLEWSTSPEGVEPDGFSAEIYGSCVSVTAGPYSLGEHYVSIRANGWGITASDEWATFGPFTVTDCNANGRLDVCEITCTPTTSYPELVCLQSDYICSGLPNCGTAADCNHNAAPDECDTANGTSEDCNENGVPDECESISHWGGGDGLWTTASSWVEGVAPANGNHVCIQDSDEAITVTYSSGTTQVGILACDENFSVAAGVSQSAQLTLAGPSFVRGDLSLTNNNSVLRVDNRLDIDGLFKWTGSNSSSHATLTGSGTTYAHGGMHVLGANSLSLDNHDLVLGGQSVVLAGRIDFAGESTITILPGATHEHQSTHAVIQSFGGSPGAALHNEGTLIKSVTTGNTAILTPSTNSGLVHVKAGTLSFMYPSVNTGAFLADPGTILALGQGEFEPTSSIVGEHVDFQAGSTANIRGTYNVSDITGVHSPVTFASGANIINYGANFGVYTNAATFNAVVGRTIHFETLYISSVANFNSGDPIVAETMTLTGGGGVFAGPSPITVDGLFTWGAGAGITGPGVVNVNERMDVGPGGGQKSLYNRTINNAGLTTMNGRFEMLSSSVFNNLPTGVFDILIDGTIIGSGSTTPFNNAGLVVKSAGGGISTIRAPISNTGTVEVRTGTLLFGYPFVQTAGETILNGGNIATSNSPAPRVDGGRLRGSGTIGTGLNNVGGIVEPGLSVGSLTVAGSYVQGPGGALRIEIGGLTPATEFDQLIQSGSGVMTLDGTIEILFV
ncbi:MAG: hypothetical protein Q7R41_15215, partial [Phycisphaerales bacterium]|nr:hypothetical protein [Phycisphaerales bacterium]